MKRWWWFLMLMVGVGTASAQNGVVQGFCVQGATKANVSGLQSINTLQGVVPKCTVTVYATGTTNKSTIYADASGTVLANPFTATTTGMWTFYAATAGGYDVVLSGGLPPTVYTNPVTFTALGANGTSGNSPVGPTDALAGYVGTGSGGVSNLGGTGITTDAATHEQLYQDSTATPDASHNLALATNSVTTQVDAIPGNPITSTSMQGATDIYTDTIPGFDHGNDGYSPQQLWAVAHARTLYFNKYGAGIGQGSGWNCSHFGVGDSSCVYAYLVSNGGRVDVSAESAVGGSISAEEHNSTYNGTVATGGAGATTVKINCLGGCEGPGVGVRISESKSTPFTSFVQFVNQTVGAIVINSIGAGQTPGTYNLTAAGGNFTVAATAQVVVGSGGTITSATVTNGGFYTSSTLPTFTLGEGGTPGTLGAAFAPTNTYMINDAVTPSTAYGTLAATLAVNNPATPSDITTWQSTTFTPTSITGTFAVGDKVCFEGGYTEMSQITAVSGSTITVPLRQSHPAGGRVFANGPCGTGVDFAANIVDSHHYPQYVVGATDAHHLVIFNTEALGGNVYYAALTGPAGSGLGTGTITRTSGVVTINVSQAAPDLRQDQLPLFSGTSLSIRGSSVSSLNGPCANPVHSAVSQLQCTQTGSDVTDSGQTAIITAGDTGYGNSRFELKNIAEIVDVRDLTQPSGQMLDGTFHVTPNIMNWTVGESVTQDNHPLIQVQALSLATYIHNPGGNANSGISVVAQGNSIQGQFMLHALNFPTGLGVPGEHGIYLDGIFQDFITSRYSPSFGGSIIQAGCPPTTLACSDPAAYYYLFNVNGNQGNYNQTFYPAKNTLTDYMGGYPPGLGYSQSYFVRTPYSFMMTVSGNSSTHSLGVTASGAVADGSLICTLNGTNCPSSSGGQDIYLDITQPPFSATCNATYSTSTQAYTGTDETAKVQQWLTALGNVGPTPSVSYELSIQGDNGNAAQLVGVIPPGRNCLVSSPLTGAVGININGNQSKIVSNTAGGGGLSINFTQSNTPASYGVFKTHIANLGIVGSGANTSTVKGLYMQLPNKALIENVDVVGFRENLDVTQMQYTTIRDSSFHNGYIGCHIEADSRYPTLPSIDSYFTNTSCRLNAYINLWDQDGGHDAFTNMDANMLSGYSGQLTSVLLGGQIPAYISNIAVSGGSGGPANATIPISITDSTGTGAIAYITTNGSGVPNPTALIEQGMSTAVSTANPPVLIGYTAPTGTVSGFTTPPTFTFTLINDQTGGPGGTPRIGDYLGSTAGLGDDHFTDLKIESSVGNQPVSGFMIINNGANNETFTNLNTGVDTGFTRSIFNNAQYLALTNFIFRDLSSPQNIACTVVNVQYQGVMPDMTYIPGGADTKMLNNFCNTSLTTDYNKTGLRAISSDGTVLSFGNKEIFGYYGNPADQSQQAGDSQMRFLRDFGGNMSWGNGAGARDTSLSHSGTAQMTTTGAWLFPSLTLTSSTATCSSATAGQFNYVAGATGVKDTVQICAKDASNTYAFRTIY